MTELKYVSTPQDCELVWAALNKARGLPRPGINSVTQEPIVSNAVRDQMLGTWWLLTPEQRKDPRFWAPWAGWEMQFSYVIPEPLPGIRAYTLFPDTPIAEIITDAAAVHGVQLTLQETNILLAAGSTLLAALPANWTPLPEEP